MQRVSSNTCLWLTLLSGTDACATVPTTSRIIVGSKISTGSSWVRSASPCPSFHRLAAPVTPQTSPSILTQTWSPLRFLGEMIPSSTGEQGESLTHPTQVKEKSSPSSTTIKTTRALKPVISTAVFALKKEI